MDSTTTTEQICSGPVWLPEPLAERMRRAVCLIVDTVHNAKQQNKSTAPNTSPLTITSTDVKDGRFVVIGRNPPTEVHDAMVIVDPHNITSSVGCAWVVKIIPQRFEIVNEKLTKLCSYVMSADTYTPAVLANLIYDMRTAKAVGSSAQNVTIRIACEHPALLTAVTQSIQKLVQCFLPAKYRCEADAIVKQTPGHVDVRLWSCYKLIRSATKCLDEADFWAKYETTFDVASHTSLKTNPLGNFPPPIIHAENTYAAAESAINEIHHKLYIKGLDEMSLLTEAERAAARASADKFGVTPVIASFCEVNHALCNSKPDFSAPTIVCDRVMTHAGVEANVRIEFLHAAQIVSMRKVDHVGTLYEKAFLEVFDKTYTSKTTGFGYVSAADRNSFLGAFRVFAEYVRFTSLALGVCHSDLHANNILVEKLHGDSKNLHTVRLFAQPSGFGITNASHTFRIIDYGLAFVFSPPCTINNTTRTLKYETPPLMIRMQDLEYHAGMRHVAALLIDPAQTAYHIFLLEARSNASCERRCKIMEILAVEMVKLANVLTEWSTEDAESTPALALVPLDKFMEAVWDIISRQLWLGDIACTPHLDIHKWYENNKIWIDYRFEPCAPFAIPDLIAFATDVCDDSWL